MKVQFDSTKIKFSSEITIVGAGPAGLLSAWLLAKEGYQVAVLERSDEIKRKVCGEYLCPKGVELLKELGIGATVLAGFRPVMGMKIYSPSGREIVSHFPDGQGSFGASLNRREFDQRLVDLCREAKVQFYFGQQLTEIKKSNFGHQLTTTDYQISTRLLIGADGRNSTVAKLLQLNKKVKDKKIAVHFIARGTGKFKREDFERLGQMHLFPGGSYIGIDPINADEVNVSLVCSSALLKNSTPSALIRSFLVKSANLAQFAEFVETSQVRAVYPITHKVKTPVSRNVALVGDAAGFLDPLTGEGIYNGLLMANQLANSIVEHQDSLFNFETPLAHYRDLKASNFRQKIILNTIFQWIIKKEWVMERLADFLLQKKERANIFIGIIGNIYRPTEGIRLLTYRQ